MEKLSASLQSKIESRPTKTILREDNEKVNAEFIDIIKQIFFYKYTPPRVKL